MNDDLISVEQRILSTVFIELHDSVVSDSIDNIFIDLDGVTADFEGEMNRGGHTADVFKLKPGSYLWLPPMDGALQAIKMLQLAFPDRVWFLTKPPKSSPYAYVEKALWVQRHFGDEGLHKLIVAQDKSLMGTEKSLLIDDRPHKGGVARFRGQLLHFGVNASSVGLPCVDWFSTLAQIDSLIKSRRAQFSSHSF